MTFTGAPGGPLSMPGSLCPGMPDEQADLAEASPVVGAWRRAQRLRRDAARVDEAGLMLATMALLLDEP